MRGLRFTIRGILGIIVFLAVAIASLREATEPWERGVFGITLMVLLMSVNLAIHRTELRGAYWLGFALWGSSYLIASLIPTIESRLLITTGLRYVDSKIPGRNVDFEFLFSGPSATVTTNTTVANLAVSPNGGSLVATQDGSVRLWNLATGKLLAGTNGTTENFVRIGHSLIALILAFLGAHLSRKLYSRRESDVVSTPSSVASTNLSSEER